jgi:hypothetical protein
MGNCEFVNAEYKRQGGAHMENDHGGQEIGTGKHGRCANTAWRQLQMESSTFFFFETEAKDLPRQFIKKKRMPN